MKGAAEKVGLTIFFRKTSADFCRTNSTSIVDPWIADDATLLFDTRASVTCTLDVEKPRIPASIFADTTGGIWDLLEVDIRINGLFQLIPDSGADS